MEIRRACSYLLSLTGLALVLLGFVARSAADVPDTPTTQPPGESAEESTPAALAPRDGFDGLHPYIERLMLDTRGPADAVAQPRSANRTSFVYHTTDHFVIAAEKDKAWAEGTGDHLERFRKRFIRACREVGFPLAAQADRLAWVGFRQRHQFREYGRRVDGLTVSAMLAYYSCRTNRVVLLVDSPDSRTGAWQPPDRNGVSHCRLRHEAAHQLAYNLGLQTRGVMYPFWVAEGLATSFEPEAGIDGSMAIENRPRRRDLLEAFDEGRLRPLSQFIVQTKLPAWERENAAGAYAQAWGLWQFLVRRRARELRDYMAGLNELDPGRRNCRRLRAEFEEAFGEPTLLEKPWREFLADLSDADVADPALARN